MLDVILLIPLRYLRIRVAQLERVHLMQKKKTDKLEELLKDRDKLIAELEKQRDFLTEDIEEMKRQRDVYKGMVYKPNRTEPKKEKLKRVIGGQPGHKGYGRSLPSQVDTEAYVFAKTCPDCQGNLTRTKSTVSHTVEDIPPFLETRTKVCKYSIERQWCKRCKKEVTAVPHGVIPGARFGINLVSQILLWKYAARMPFATIAAMLKVTYGITVSQGGLAKILQRTKKYFGPFYADILKQVRAAPIKHADETGWRIRGVNGWAWVFLTKKEVYYTIEETRGKGIAQKILGGSKPTDVLIRDDYPGYKNLLLLHQSCWAHLLRKSHEAVTQKTFSKEMKKLHILLKRIYRQLLIGTKQPFDQKKRQLLYNKLEQLLLGIIQKPYQAKDAKAIQTRIKNQGTNLLTALLHQGVPLTNNDAERAIRPLVVTRKISGGSRSDAGAEAHAVNMSILQTIKMRNQPFVSTLQEYILQGSIGKN